MEPSPAVFQIEKQYRVYFDNFLKEAKLRNIKIDTTNLIIKSITENSKSKEACGTCTQTINKPSIQKTIEINVKDPSCWQTATNNAREVLVFHELGHCLLGRIEHKSDIFPDGSPKSIMFPDNRDLYSPCVYAIDDSNNCNKTERRKYYIDELFNPNTPKPSWVK